METQTNCPWLAARYFPRQVELRVSRPRITSYATFLLVLRQPSRYRLFFESSLINQKSYPGLGQPWVSQQLAVGGSVVLALPSDALVTVLRVS